MNQVDRVARYGSPTPQDAWISGGRWNHVEVSPSLSAKHAFPELRKIQAAFRRRDRRAQQAAKTE